MTITQKLTTFVAAFALVGAMVMTLAAPVANAALTESQIQSILSLLNSFGADAATVSNVETSLRGGTPSGGSSSGGSSASCSQFTRDLTLGSTGADVLALQQLLNSNGYPVNTAGQVGSAGNETTYFGSLTASALAKWQAANGVSPAVGYFGPITRAALASSGACGTTSGGGTTTPAPAGSGLTVASASQPQNALAPQGATRVPFTRFTVTAGADGAVTMNSVVVQRVGLGSNASFSGVVLIDQDGNQLGTAKSFNSNDQATVGESVVIPAGQSRTFTIAGNMASSLASYAGEVPAISVVAVNSSATVSGSLPITGAFHTINATLTVGSMSLDISSAFATNAPVTKEIGTTAYRATGFRMTAGSAEDIRLKMVRFNQTGSASTVNDLANIQVVIDGTAYPVTISADGQYVTANLGSGILIPEGNSVDAYIQYDIVGSNANGRTVVFDVDETTDIYAEGVTYGYGISPSAGSTAPSSLTDGTDNTTETSGTPYIFGAQVTVSGASVTTIGKATSVPAQNIAVNVPNQPLGGFEVDIKGEAITVQSLVVDVATTSGAGRLTNVTIVDENGSVIAGPVDSPSAATNGHSLTFTDSITFPTGKHTYTIRGKVASGSTNGATYILSTDPSSDWSTVKGDLTGDTITLSQSSFNMNTMTIKAASLAVAVSTSPAAQNIVAGGQDVLFSRLQLDASQSGEDVRISTIPLTYTNASFAGAPNNLSSCQMFDGSTALNTGSNIVNPTATASTTATFGTFTFDNPLTVAKGTVKTLDVKCNVASGADASSTYNIGITSAQIGALTVTGIDSSASVTATGSTGAGQTQTVSAGGSVVASTAAGSPSYAIAAAGTQGVVMGVYKLRASNEAVDLQRIGLQLTNTASSSAGDVVSVTLHKADGTQIGVAEFVGSNTNATSTLSEVLHLPKDTDVEVTVKAWLQSEGTNDPGTTGHLIAIDIDTNNTNTQGVGVQSGTTINATGSTSVGGVRVFKSFPTFADDSASLASTGVADGKLMRFKVTADSAGSISLSKFSITVSTTSNVTVTNLNIFAFTDSGYSIPVSGLTSTGQLLASDNTAWNSATTQLEFYAQTAGAASTTIQVSQNETLYFEVRGDVAVTGDGSVTTTLLGDAAFPSLAASTFDGTAATIDGDSNDDFIWSPNTDGSSAVGDADWTNGFNVTGLSSGGFSKTRGD